MNSRIPFSYCLERTRRSRGSRIRNRFFRRHSRESTPADHHRELLSAALRQPEIAGYLRHEGIADIKPLDRA